MSDENEPTPPDYGSQLAPGADVAVGDAPVDTPEELTEQDRSAHAAPFSQASQRTANRQRAREIVPEIGEGRRWYDLPYRLIGWLLHGKVRRLLPRWFRVRLNYLQISLRALNRRDQYRVWPEDDYHRRLNVPPDEHVSFPCVWVVELFPSSRYEALLNASKRRGWDRGRDLTQRERNQEILEASRGGRGLSWWRLANITDPRAPYRFGDEVIERLPAEFISVELRGITVGPSLTAVVGCFTLDKDADAALDDVWHAEHEPAVVRRGPTLQVQDRQWSGFRQTQQQRQSIHDAARAWMSENLLGFFATSGEPQLVLDFCLTDQFDPTAVDRGRDERENFRALGFVGFETEFRISPQVPGLILLPANKALCADLEARNVWTLWGQRDVVKEALGDSLKGFGSDLGRAVGSALDDSIRMFAVALALTAYVDAAKSQHAVMRDNATGQHRRFRPTQLRKLRRALLDLSIDVTGMERDTKAFWARKSYWDPIVRFDLVEAPRHAEWLQEQNLRVRDPIDFNKFIRQRQKRELRSLVQADSAYRDIVATVSALGASADSSRVGRLALIVATASLIAAGTTLWVTIA